jgi:hypothetical protein
VAATGTGKTVLAAFDLARLHADFPEQFPSLEPPPLLLIAHRKEILLQPLLPERHSPISTTTGKGNQGVYLAGLSETLGLLLLKLIEDHADPAVRVHLVVLAEEGDCTAALFDSERLSGANGLLLSPHVDKLFDRHWISFGAGGELIREHEAAREALRCWGIDGANLIRPFSRDQEQFLRAHREALRR